MKEKLDDVSLMYINAMTRIQQVSKKILDRSLYAIKYGCLQTKMINAK